MRLRTFLAAGAVACAALASAAQAQDRPTSAWSALTEADFDMLGKALTELKAGRFFFEPSAELVEVVASDAIRLCDEGLAMEIDVDSMLVPARDGTPASEDFSDFLVTPCFIPQIVYPSTFGYRTDMVGDTPPKDVCPVFDLENYPGKRSLEKRPINNANPYNPAFDSGARQRILKLLLGFGRVRALHLPFADGLPCRPAPEPPGPPSSQPDWYAGAAESESGGNAGVQISVEATAGQNLCRVFPPAYLLPFWGQNPEFCFRVLVADGCFCELETGFIFCPCLAL